MPRGFGRAGVEQVALHALGVLLVAALVVHFAMTALYVSPLSPVKVRHYRTVLDYMEPVFYQDWHLFSPSPPDYDLKLHVRCRMVERGTGRKRRSDWVDISSDLVRRHQEIRLSPLGALVSVQTATYYQRLVSPQTWEIVQRYVKQDPESLLAQGRDPDASVRLEFANRLAARVASAYARALHGATHDIHATKVVWELHAFPRFSQRHDAGAVGMSTFVESPWMPYEHVDS